MTRQWIDKARTSGQDLSGNAASDGTFASGVHKITELLPALIDDLIQTAPQDHKVCYIDIASRTPLVSVRVLDAIMICDFACLLACLLARLLYDCLFSSSSSLKLTMCYRQK